MRTPIASKKPPDLSKYHRTQLRYGTTLSAELRKEVTELQRVRDTLAEEQKRKEEESRNAAVAATRRRVIAELRRPSDAAKTLLQADKRRKYKECFMQRQREYDRMRRSINERVAARSFLFQQVSGVDWMTKGR